MKNDLITVTPVDAWSGKDLLHGCNSPNHRFAIYEKQKPRSIFSPGIRRVQLVDELDPNRLTKDIKLALWDIWAHAVNDSGSWVAYTNSNIFFPISDGGTKVQSVETGESYFLPTSASLHFSGDELWLLIVKKKELIVEKRSPSNWELTVQPLHISRITKRIVGGSFVETYRPDTIGLDLLSNDDEIDNELVIEDTGKGELAIRGLALPEGLLNYYFAPHGGEMIAMTRGEMIRLVYPFDQVQDRVPYQGTGQCCYLNDVYLLSATAEGKAFDLVHSRSLQVIATFVIESTELLFIDSFVRAGDWMIFTFSNQSETNDSMRPAILTVFRVSIGAFLHYTR